MRFSHAALSVIVTAVGFAGVWVVGPRPTHLDDETLSIGSFDPRPATSRGVSRVAAVAWLQQNCPHVPTITHRDEVVIADRLYIDTARLDAVQRRDGQARACEIAVEIAHTIIDAAVSRPSPENRMLFGNLAGARDLE